MGKPDADSRRAAGAAADAAVKQELAKAGDPNPGRKLDSSNPDDQKYIDLWKKTYREQLAKNKTDAPKKPTQAAAGCQRDATRLVNKVKSCPEAKKVYEEAVAANGGKVPQIQMGDKTETKLEESPSAADPYKHDKTAQITVDKSRSPCDQVQELVFELANLAQRAEFEKLDNQAARGELTREEYVRRREKLEWESQKRVWKAFDSCKGKWGCGKSKALNEDARGKDFDKFYDIIPDKHKDAIRTQWNNSYEQKRRAYLNSRMMTESDENVYGVPSSGSK